MDKATLREAIDVAVNKLNSDGASVAAFDIETALKALERLGWKIVGPEVTKEQAHALEENFAKCLPPSDIHRENWREAFGNMHRVSPSVDELLAEGEKS